MLVAKGVTGFAALALAYSSSANGATIANANSEQLIDGNGNADSGKKLNRRSKRSSSLLGMCRTGAAFAACAGMSQAADVLSQHTKDNTLQQQHTGSAATKKPPLLMSLEKAVGGLKVGKKSLEKKSKGSALLAAKLENLQEVQDKTKVKRMKKAAFPELAGKSKMELRQQQKPGNGQKIGNMNEIGGHDDLFLFTSDARDDGWDNARWSFKQEFDSDPGVHHSGTADGDHIQEGDHSVSADGLLLTTSACKTFEVPTPGDWPEEIGFMIRDRSGNTLAQCTPYWNEYVDVTTLENLPTGFTVAPPLEPRSAALMGKPHPNGHFAGHVVSCADVKVSCDCTPNQPDVGRCSTQLQAGLLPLSDTQLLVEMYDTYADGWDGAWGSFKHGSLDAQVFTLESGAAGEKVLSLDAADPCQKGTFEFTDEGSWPGEVSWEMKNHHGIYVADGHLMTGAVDVYPCGLAPGLTLIMMDTWGDGWDTAKFKWKKNGVEVISDTLDTGSVGEKALPAAGGGDFGCGDEYTFKIDPTGEWPTEISWVIKDPTGAALASGGAGDNEPDVTLTPGDSFSYCYNP